MQGKFQFYIDNTYLTIDETVEEIADLPEGFEFFPFTCGLFEKENLTYMGEIIIKNKD